MATRKWLDEVALALRRQGFSGAYIRRFTEELADHCEDLLQEHDRMDANLLVERLGLPDDLAHRAAKGLRQRTYAGRHPLVMFVAAPLPTAALLLVGLCAAFLLVLSVLPEGAANENYVPDWAELVMQGIVWTMRFAPFVAGAVLFCHLARRAFCGLRWSFVACALVALLALVFMVSFTLPTNGPGSGALTLGFGLPPRPAQWIQVLPPIAVWLVYAGLDRRRSRLVQ